MLKAIILKLQIKALKLNAGIVILSKEVLLKTPPINFSKSLCQYVLMILNTAGNHKKPIGFHQ